jgi:hypothetical protein
MVRPFTPGLFLATPMYDTLEHRTTVYSQTMMSLLQYSDFTYLTTSAK